MASIANRFIAKTFGIIFKCYEADLEEMAPEEILRIMDVVGEEYRNSAPEFTDEDSPEEPFGKALIKVWGQSLPPYPKDGASKDEESKWTNEWYRQVKVPFCERYNFDVI